MIINLKPYNKINERLLRQELEAIQANAKIQINQSMNWNRFPYRDGLPCPDHITPPDDIDAPWRSPFWIEIRNGEEDNKAAFEAAIAAHDPAMTDSEERLQAANQQRAQELLEALMLLPDEYLSQIKARFDALP
jgi:hypothetical protein